MPSEPFRRVRASSGARDTDGGWAPVNRKREGMGLLGRDRYSACRSRSAEEALALLERLHRRCCEVLDLPHTKLQDLRGRILDEIPNLGQGAVRLQEVDGLVGERNDRNQPLVLD